jgi:hypothetical protein
MNTDGPAIELAHLVLALAAEGAVEQLFVVLSLGIVAIQRSCSAGS